jgi:hypothetical protein
LTTNRLADDSFVGSGHLHATGLLRKGEYAQLAYSLDNKTVHGYGVIIMQFAPSRLKGDGYSRLFCRSAAFRFHLAPQYATLTTLHY